MSSAELCRRRGWTVGTVLVAERLPKEERGEPLKVVITAVGEKQVMVVDWIRDEGGDHIAGDEYVLELRVRDWRFATQLARGDTA
jgi:hypothetical protein